MSLAQPSLQQTLRKVIDPHFGIANRLVELPANSLAPDVFVSLVDGGPPSYFIDHGHADWFNCSNGSGAAYTRQSALWATLGEMLERYCAAIYDRSSFLEASAAALGASAIPVPDVILFSEAQYSLPDFPFSPFNPRAQMPWAGGINLVTGETAFAPAQLLYLSHEWARHMLMQTVSTGLACHIDRERACLSGLLEVIERDGFAASWLLGMPLPKLALSEADRAKLSLQTLRALDNKTLALSLHAIPNAFGVANVFVFAEHRELGHGTVGGATKLCPYEAIEKAVLEALHGWIGFTQATFQHDELPTLETLQKPHDHALYYLRPNTWAHLNPFRSSSVTLSPRDLTAARKLETSSDVIAALRNEGYDSYLFDLTTPDVCALGFHAVRTIVPGLQPLSFGQTPLSEDRRRLTRLASFWDWPMPAKLQSRPHPFP